MRLRPKLKRFNLNLKLDATKRRQKAIPGASEAKIGSNLPWQPAYVSSLLSSLHLYYVGNFSRYNSCRWWHASTAPWIQTSNVGCLPVPLYVYPSPPNLLMHLHTIWLRSMLHLRSKKNCQDGASYVAAPCVTTTNHIKQNPKRFRTPSPSFQARRQDASVGANTCVTARNQSNIDVLTKASKTPRLRTATDLMHNELRRPEQARIPCVTTRRQVGVLLKRLQP